MRGDVLRAASWLALFSLLSLVQPAPASALEPSPLFSLTEGEETGPDAWTAGYLRPPADAPVRLALEGATDPSSPSSGASGGDTPAEAKKPSILLSALIPALAIAGSAANSFLDGPNQSYHFTSEGWFGKNTFAGGADKAAHFTDFYIVSREMAFLYEKLGYSPGVSRLIGFGVSAVTGLVTEIGDGTNVYGFSYEDLISDVVGAGLAALVAHFGVDDLVGFRAGFLLPQNTETCCPVHAPGRDYSNELYTADLRLAGVARRLGWNIGPLKYLLLSATYGSKGYPRGDVETRERQIGIEVGLDFRQIADDLGVTRNTWWGYAIHVLVDNFRFPFTAGGFRYDLNHKKWHGIDSGNSFGFK
jgi:hypothetical protein